MGHELHADVDTDISTLKAHERVLAQAHRTALSASLTDELTGASNRRHILALCRDALEHGAGAQGLCIVMVDLDHFKAINDGSGHDAGDGVLRHFVNLCKSLLRPTDLFRRVGGEEFLLLISGSSGAVAKRVVDRFRRLLSPADAIAYSFSAGIVQSNAGMSLEQVLARADEALYQATSQGRGKTIVSKPLGRPIA